MRFLGVVVLVTRFEFCSRRELWSKDNWSKYIPTPMLGRTGVSRDRFDDVFSSLRFSHQPSEIPENTTSEEYRWMLLNDHINKFNEHRKHNYYPSTTMCVDESMSKWNGLGGDWINKGIPHYVAIDRKPEDGGEIQDMADGESGCLLQLKVVKSPACRDRAPQPAEWNGLNEGTKTVLQLTQPWSNKATRIVVGDSAFASVQTTRECWKRNLRWIGHVKTATRGFPMTRLGNVQLTGKGDVSCMTAYDEELQMKMMAFVWVDRTRRYFISSARSVGWGSVYERTRWRQRDPIFTNLPPERLNIEIPQPVAAETYYSACGKVDNHNRARQWDLGLENKLVVRDWDQRMNLTVFGMAVTDSWLIFKMVTRSSMVQKQYYRLLADALIDNPFRTPSAAPSTRSARRESSESGGSQDMLGSCGKSDQPHLTPGKRIAPNHISSSNKKHVQKRCVTCKALTIRVCSECRLDPDIKDCDAVFCDPATTGRFCYREHLSQCH